MLGGGGGEGTYSRCARVIWYTFYYRLSTWCAYVTWLIGRPVYLIPWRVIDSDSRHRHRGTIIREAILERTCYELPSWRPIWIERSPDLSVPRRSLPAARVPLERETDQMSSVISKLKTSFRPLLCVFRFLGHFREKVGWIVKRGRRGVFDDRFNHFSFTLVEIFLSSTKDRFNLI